MLLGGVRREHSFAGAAESIPAQWQALVTMLPLPGQQGTTAYGVMCGADPQAQTFEYMTGAEVAALDALGPGYGRMRIPAQRYAVFIHPGHPSTLHTTWAAIWNDWLPRSGYQPANTPEFEVYGERFDFRDDRFAIRLLAFELDLVAALVTIEEGVARGAEPLLRRVRLADGDEMVIAFQNFGRPLRNPIRIAGVPPPWFSLNGLM